MDDPDEQRRRGIEREVRALPTAGLVALLRAEPYDSERYHEALAALHLRGGPAEFAAGELLARSELATDRVIGADVLAQLGAGTPTFVEESAALLRAMLSDADPRVLRAAGIALGHRRSVEALPALIALRTHASAGVRLGVAFGVMWSDRPDVIDALVELSRDPDRDVRNWATFGLGSMQDEANTPALRDALLARTEDDGEVRGEALLGLAKRRDVRVLPALRRELAGEFHGDWCVEAAGLTGDASLLGAVIALRARLGEKDARAFARTFDEAVRALGG